MCVTECLRLKENHILLGGVCSPGSDNMKIDIKVLLQQLAQLLGKCIFYPNYFILKSVRFTNIKMHNFGVWETMAAVRLYFKKEAGIEQKHLI